MITQIELREDQQQIADHPARFKVVACGRRWGKTTLALVLAIRAAREGKRVWWVAPTYGMAFHPWRDLKTALAGEWTAKLEHDRFIEFEGGGSISVKSADDPDSLRGVGLDFVVIDEAAYVNDLTWGAVLRPALSDRGGSALLISTPHGGNWFWHLWQRGRDPQVDAWESWSAPTSANPIIPEGDIAEAQMILAPRVFEQEYLAQFVEIGGAIFTEPHKSAMLPEQVPTEPEPAHRYVMGVDFGRYGDFTVCTVIDATTNRMVAMDRFNILSWSVQRGRIAALAKAWNVASILAETNAMGEPNIEALRAEGLPVLAFSTTALSKMSLIEGLVRALDEKRLRLLPDKVLLDELASFTYRIGRHYTHYTAPVGRHDDTVIALALAWQVANVPRLSFAIAEV